MSLAYDTDFFAWTREQADALERRSANELDWENLREEIDRLGKSLKRELGNRLRVLISHLLKWRGQPDLRSNSWVYTIVEQRRSLLGLIDENLSLTPQMEDAFRAAWALAVIDAALETGYEISDFPQAPTFSLAHAMTVPIALDEAEPQRRSRTRKTKA